MNRKLLALACLATLALSACTREEPAPVATPEPAPSATEPTDAIEATPNAVASTEAPAFDQKAFAGTFSAGDTRLELMPDGTYAIADSDAKMDGTWTVEADDKQIRLDPNTKSQDDRLFAITGNDELAPLGADGRPATGQASLKRAGGTPAAQ